MLASRFVLLPAALIASMFLFMTGFLRFHPPNGIGAWQAAEAAAAPGLTRKEMLERSAIVMNEAVRAHFPPVSPPSTPTRRGESLASSPSQGHHPYSIASSHHTFIP